MRPRTGSDGLFYGCAKTLGDSIRVGARLDNRLVGESVQRATGRLTVVPLRVIPPQ